MIDTIAPLLESENESGLLLEAVSRVVSAKSPFALTRQVSDKAAYLVEARGVPKATA
jgi:hypothetical protein